MFKENRKLVESWTFDWFNQRAGQQLIRMKLYECSGFLATSKYVIEFENKCGFVFHSENYASVSDSLLSGNYLTGDAHRSSRQICTMMLALGTITKRDVCEFRRVMEKSACMLLTAKDLEAEDRQKFRGILEDMESAADERQALLDRDFHALLLQATGNPLMTTILDAVSDVYQEWIDIVINRAGADEKAKLHGYHRGIVDGISAGDMEGTVRCVDGHYDLIEKLLEI